MYTFDWLAKQADLRPHQTALVDAATGRRFTYPEFHLRASRFAEFVQREWRLAPGERVALLAPNSSDYFEILWGCAKAEVILVCLNWRLAVPELEFIMRDATPTALIYDPAFKDAAQALKARFGLSRVAALGEPQPGEIAYESALAGASGRPVVMRPRGLDENWHLLYTAGTTGKPKGVLQTFGMVLYNALNIGLPSDLTSEDVTLNLLPCFHTGGLNLYTNPTFHVGGTAIVQKSFEPAETLRLLAEEATAFFGVSAVYLFLSQHPDFERTEFKRMRCWSAGGAPIPTSLLQRYLDRGIEIRFGFGMTETGPTVFLIEKDYPRSKLGSVGKPQLHVDVRIVDRQGQDVPAGERGELLIKGPGVTPGYWQLPEVTAESIVDGWLHSGDVAMCDGDGYYYIVDRWKDMFISGGENVYPAEVENVIYQLPQVAEAAVIGVPDEKWGEVGRAFVVVKPGQTLDEAEIIEHCRQNIARYKVPRSVAFIAQLPRNPAGKVVKGELRALVSSKK
ncbi:long-chain fatty acid--CoA ligase [Promineifilum sp.]|uniref:acyl-CoA synthetase n=1 Tax=Promineifilum sp. TaxID=2664178 RepID=UPI0035B35118